MEQLQRLYVIYEKVEMVTQRTVLSMITPKKQGRLKPFIEFMQEDDSNEVIKLFSLKKTPIIFWTGKFHNSNKREILF